MKNVHLVRTENYSELVHSTNKYGGLFLSRHYSPMKEMGDSYQHIYITSDEEIKEGDWFYNIVSLKPEPFKACENGDGYVNCSKYSHYRIDCKKIILTTNPLLDGVQAIDDEFLEWFVKNPSREYVNFTSHGNEKGTKDYELIIPKKVPKQEQIEEVECNNCGYLMSLTEDESVYACYNSECTSCYEEYEEETLEEVECNNCGYLMSLTEDESVYACYNSECTSCYEEYEEETLEEVECNNCGYLMSLTEDESVYACYNSECTSCYEEYEEETLEEAACKALGYDYNDWVSLFSKDKSTVIYSEVTNWCKGAKWQQERMYSEEDMIRFAEFVATHPDKNKNVHGQMLHAKSKYDGAERTIDLLEQFKKK